MAYNNPIVLVMGPSGTGKTRFVNLAAGRYIFEEGSGLEATTTRAQSVQIALDDRELEVFDTPGPDADEGGAGKACLFQLLHKLAQRDIVGIIYMHDISQNRASRPVVESYKWLLEACGHDVMRNLVIVTNMWSNNAGYNEGRERELQWGEPCYKTAIGSGASLRRHDNTQESALAILHSVARNSPIILRCQMPASMLSFNSGSTCVGTVNGVKEGEKPVGGCFNLLWRHKTHRQSKRVFGEKDDRGRGCGF